MNSKQVVGILGSVLVILGSFLPVFKIPIFGGVSYAFPPGGGVGDGLFVAACGVLGLLGAVRGGSLLLLLFSIVGALILGYTISNIMGYIGDAQSTGGLSSAMASTVSLDYGVGVIGTGLLLMLVSSAMKAEL
ncbi:MAG: hypothetical protein AAFS02_16730 [Pseudomonadota bacterium]